MTHHGGTQTSTRTSIYQHAHDLPFTISRGRHSRTSSVQLLFSSRYSSNPRVGDVVLEPPLPMLVQFINVGDLLDDIIVPSAVAYSVKPLLGSVAMCGLVQIVHAILRFQPNQGRLPFLLDHEAFEMKCVFLECVLLLPCQGLKLNVFRSSGLILPKGFVVQRSLWCAINA
jgi:hypothetical protein